MEIDDIIRRRPVRRDVHYIPCDSKLSLLRPWAHGFLDFAVLRQRPPISTAERTDTAMSIARQILE
eukprot:5338014-Prorocentrum_lima.AAC.1